MTPENLLTRSLIADKLTLGCPLLDRCLGGGVPCCSITELVAESSCGKTQFCLQLALSAQLPPSHGGLSASSLYLHTEFPFPFRRLHQLSQAFQSSHANLVAINPCEDVYVHAVHDAHQMLDIMPKIESFIESEKTRLPVRLIVIDSIAALFRTEFNNTPLDLKRRSSLFFKIAGKLKSLANRFRLAVVVTNQVVDFMGASDGVNGVKVGNFGSLDSSGRRVCPALGLAWANCVNSRLFLSRNEVVVGEGNSNELEDGFCRQTKRRLDILFAPHLPQASCEFVITRQGVFGVESASANKSEDRITTPLVLDSLVMRSNDSEAKFLRKEDFLKHDHWVTLYTHGKMFPLIEFTRREGLDIYYVAYVDGSKGRRPVGCSGGNGGCHMEIQMIHIAEKMMRGKMALDGKFEAEVKLILGLGSLQLGEVKNMLL
ncbi:hypothetical protein TB2_014998 [Malus domestica]